MTVYPSRGTGISMTDDTTPPLVATRDALESGECPDCGHAAWSHHVSGDCNVTIYASPEDGFYPSEHCNCDRTVVDALLASGVVRDPATLADSLCKLLCDMAGEPRLFIPSEIRAALAAALTEEPA